MKNNGIFIAYKSAKVNEEIEKAQNTLKTLNSKVEEIFVSDSGHGNTGWVPLDEFETITASVVQSHKNLVSSDVEESGFE